MSDGQRPGESDRDYIRRLSQESANLKRIRRDERIQDRLDEDARVARNIRADNVSDQEADAMLRDFMGASMNDIQRAYAAGKFSNDPAIQKAVEDAKAALSKGTKGGRRRAMNKVTKGASGRALKKAGKQAKGCTWVAAVIVGAGLSAMYGMYEGGAALIGALAH